jgi:hypothetical protein
MKQNGYTQNDTAKIIGKDKNKTKNKKSYFNNRVKAYIDQKLSQISKKT